MSNASLLYVSKSGDTMTGALNLPTDGLNVGSGELVTSGGNVGIGTSSPVASLQVQSTASTNLAQIGDAPLDSLPHIMSVGKNVTNPLDPSNTIPYLTFDVSPTITQNTNESAPNTGYFFGMVSGISVG